MATTKRAGTDLWAAYSQDLDPAQRGAFTGWMAFTATFVAVRGITHAIHDDRGPFHDVTVGGAHLHHYMWGILGLTAVGAVAVRGEVSEVRHPLVATTYGSSLALIVDEFALLLDLQDVYWLRQGRLSVDIATTMIGLTGAYFYSIPLAKRFRSRRRARAERREPVPPPAGTVPQA